MLRLSVIPVCLILTACPPDGREAARSGPGPETPLVETGAPRLKGPVFQPLPKKSAMTRLITDSVFMRYTAVSTEPDPPFFEVRSGSNQTVLLQHPEDGSSFKWKTVRSLKWTLKNGERQTDDRPDSNEEYDVVARSQGVEIIPADESPLTDARKKALADLLQDGFTYEVLGRFFSEIAVRQGERIEAPAPVCQRLLADRCRVTPKGQTERWHQPLFEFALELEGDDYIALANAARQTGRLWIDAKTGRPVAIELLSRVELSDPIVQNGMTFSGRGISSHRVAWSEFPVPGIINIEAHLPNAPAGQLLHTQLSGDARTLTMLSRFGSTSQLSFFDIRSRRVTATLPTPATEMFTFRRNTTLATKDGFVTAILHVSRPTPFGRYTRIFRDSQVSALTNFGFYPVIGWKNGMVVISNPGYDRPVGGIPLYQTEGDPPLSSVSALASNGDGTRIAIARADNSLSSWKVRYGKTRGCPSDRGSYCEKIEVRSTQKVRSTTLPTKVRSIDFLDNGAWLVLTQDGVVGVWSIENDAVEWLKVRALHIAGLQDGKRFATETGIYHRNGRRLTAFPSPKSAVVDLNASDDGETIARGFAAADGSRVELLDGKTGRIFHTVVPTVPPIETASVLGSTLSLGFNDRPISVDLATLEVAAAKPEAHKPTGPSTGTWSVVWSADRRLRAEWVANKVTVYSSDTGEAVGSCRIPAHPYTTESNGQEVQRDDMGMGSVLHFGDSAHGKIYGGTYSRHLFACSTTEHQPQPLYIVPMDGLISAAPWTESPDGRTLALAGRYRTSQYWNPSIPIIELRDARTGARIRDLTPDWGEATRITFSSDGQMLAMGTTYGSIIVWDVASGINIRRHNQHEGAITGLIAHNRHLYSTARDGLVRVWDFEAPAPLDSELSQLERRMLIGDLLGLWRETQPVATIAVLGDRAVAITADGYYMGGKNDLSKMSLTVLSKTFDFRRQDVAMNRADVVLRRLGHADREHLDLWDSIVRYRWRMMGYERVDTSSRPPWIDWTADPQASIDAPSIKVAVQIAPRDRDLGRLRAYVNSVPAAQDGLTLSPTASSTVNVDLQIALDCGPNRVSIIAEDKVGAQSEPLETIITRTEDCGPKDLYVVAAGVSNYQVEDLKLRYAVKDAQDLVSTFRNARTKEVPVGAHSDFERR